MWQALCINTNWVKSLINFVYLNSSIFNLHLSCFSDYSKDVSFSLTCEAKLYNELGKKSYLVCTRHHIVYAIKILMFLVCISKRHSPLPKINLLYKKCERIAGNFVEVFSSHLFCPCTLYFVTKGCLFLCL